MAREIKRCGARRKFDGQPCHGRALKNGRCKMHGGKSTGPKTAEGRARIGFHLDDFEVVNSATRTLQI
jgi:hypothetical protein